ncbi:hypothetical protein [Rhizobium leguminosarum]
MDKAAEEPKLEAAPKPAKQDSPGFHTSYLHAKTFALALIDSLDTSKPIKAVDEALGIANKLAPSNVKDVLLTAFNDANGDIDPARKQVATWFDGAMDRLSGQYERKIQMVTLGLGLACAAALNADSFAVTRELWRNETLRNEFAQKVADLSGVGGNACTDKVEDEKVSCELKSLNSQLAELAPLPLGWTASSTDRSLSDVLLKICRLILTALAISLGAPFWFDLLQKFVSVRGTGKKPEEA